MKANGPLSHPLLSEVTKMVDITSRHAEHLAGGRKRIFERAEGEDTRPLKRQRYGYAGKRRRDSYRPADKYAPAYRHRRDDYDDRDDCDDSNDDQDDHLRARDDSRGHDRDDSRRHPKDSPSSHSVSHFWT